MSDSCYTALTFAPVQGFIEKSRKLRDLYGSSFILSYLARAICLAAGEERVISPALINLTQGTPNQIVIRGEFPEKEARIAFYQAWRTLVVTCREWIERKLPHYRYAWRKDWDRWGSHAWEFFWAQGDSITEARRTLNELKRSRAWVGINWIGESSTLSGADAIAWPHMSQAVQPKDRSLGQEDRDIREFYRQLIGVLGEAFVDETEQLSIPELMKRLITYQPIATQLEIAPEDRPENFRDLNLSRREENRWTGWFQGDGDSIGVYLRSLRNQGEEAVILRQFSQALMNWGRDYLTPSVEKQEGRVIYAGGDDFLGVFYQAPSAQTCLDWFYRFKTEVWQQHQQGISVSVGFVWAAPGVPQRDVLQHCKEAEQSAKSQGRDRIALRILFNGGNSLEWVCPWWFLESVLTSYRDRNEDTATSQASKWTHLYNDVAALEARHAFQGHQTDVAIALFEVYFGSECRSLLERHLWDSDGKTGILGNCSTDCPNPTAALNQWVISLAKVGFHLMAPSPLR